MHSTAGTSVATINISRHDRNAMVTIMVTSMITLSSITNSSCT